MHKAALAVSTQNIRKFPTKLFGKGVCFPTIGWLELFIIIILIYYLILFFFLFNYIFVVDWRGGLWDKKVKVKRRQYLSLISPGSRGWALGLQPRHLGMVRLKFML